MSVPNVIGEGAYGCIHKPSLLCKGNTISSYKKKVSKIMPKDDAKKELNEYNRIRDIDTLDEYYLGYPIECQVANIPKNIQAIEKCENGKELVKELDDVSLLVMNDGGINLQEYADKMENYPSTPENIANMERFFIEFHRIIRGIHMYLNHGILHCDMKPQNILISEETGRLNIIDFGLTTTIKSKISKSRESINPFAKYHWSYPFEMVFLNKDMYMFFATLPQEQKDQYYESILRDILDQQLPYRGGLSAKKAMTTLHNNYIDAIQGFYSYIFDYSTDIEEFKQHMAGFYQTIAVELTSSKYNAFVKKSIHTIDVYGTGITLLYIVKKTKHLLTPKLYEDLFELGYSMVSAQLSTRITCGELMDRYESILTENNIMKKHAMYFKDHKVISGEPIPNKMKIPLNSITMGDILLNQQELDKIAISIHAPIKSPKPGYKRTKKYNMKTGGKRKSCTNKRRR